MNQRVRCTAIPSPATNAAAAIAHVGAPSASVWSESSAANSTHATRGRRGRTRIATKLPTTAPTPPAVRIVAQAPAPPRRSTAIAGPRTFHPAKVRFPSPKKTTDAQSHVRDVNSCQPSRSSVKNPMASVVSRAATRIRRRRSAQRQAVGEDAAADHDERLNPLADGEDDAERGGRPDVEHREGERDPGHPVADRGDHRPGEEQAEVALPEGAEAVVERDRHDR